MGVQRFDRQARRPGPFDECRQFVIRQTHDAERDLGQLSDHRLDLRQLQPMARKFHLVVDASQICQPVIAQHADPIAAAVADLRAGQKARRVVGWVQVAGSHMIPAD